MYIIYCLVVTFWLFDTFSYPHQYLKYKNFLNKIASAKILLLRSSGKSKSSKSVSSIVLLLLTGAGVTLCKEGAAVGPEEGSRELKSCLDGRGVELDLTGLESRSMTSLGPELCWWFSLFGLATGDGWKTILCVAVFCFNHYFKNKECLFLLFS